MNYDQVKHLQVRHGLALEMEGIKEGMAFEQVIGNFMRRLNPLPKKGDITGNHEHHFDHMSFVANGSIRVVARDLVGNILWENDFVARDPVRDCFLVKKEVRHEITALEDDTLFYCMYSHRTPQGDVVQEYTGYEAAYR